jgi:hypothetical protein
VSLPTIPTINYFLGTSAATIVPTSNAEDAGAAASESVVALDLRGGVAVEHRRVAKLAKRGWLVYLRDHFFFSFFFSIHFWT